MRGHFFDNVEFKNLLQRYEKAVEHDKVIYLEENEFTDLADYYFTRNKFDKAGEVCLKAAEFYPDSPLIQVLQANMYLNIYNDLDKAREILDGIEDRTDFEYIYTNIDVLLREGQHQEALDYINEVAETIPSDELDSFALDITELLIDNDDIEHAKQWFEKCSNKDDDYLEIKARILFEEENFKEVIRIITDILNRHPYEEELWSLLAKAQFIDGQDQEALTSCDFAIAIEPEGSYAEQIMAHILFSNGHPQEAIEHYVNYLKYFPDDIQCIDRLASCYILTHDYHNAIQLLESLLKSQTTWDAIDYNIYRSLAMAYSGIGMYEKAIHYINIYDEESGNHAYNQLLKAQIYFENNLQEEAYTAIVKATNLANGAPDIVTDAVLILHDNGYFDFAYKLISTLMTTIDYDYGKGEACLSLLAYRMKKRDEYLNALKLAVEYDKDSANIILGQLFPMGTIPEDFYSYAYNNHLI